MYTCHSAWLTLVIVVVLEVVCIERDRERGWKRERAREKEQERERQRERNELSNKEVQLFGVEITSPSLSSMNVTKAATMENIQTVLYLRIESWTCYLDPAPGKCRHFLYYYPRCER